MTGRRRQAHQGHGAKPGGFDEGPDEEAVEIKVFSSAGSFGVAEFGGQDFSGGVAGERDDLVCFEAFQGFFEVDLDASGWVDEFTAEELEILA